MEATGRPPLLSESTSYDRQRPFTTILNSIFNHIDQSFTNGSLTPQGGAERELEGTCFGDNALAASYLAPLVAYLAQDRLLLIQKPVCKECLVHYPVSWFSSLRCNSHVCLSRWWATQLYMQQTIPGANVPFLALHQLQNL